jgi:YegS/Rv2252/BmrU family lipid kinase
MDAIIANPRAGRGRVQKKLKEVEAILGSLGLRYKLYITEKPGQATEYSKEILNSGKFDRIIILGGDGTINEVIQPLVGSDVPILPLPLGTGNDFVKFFYPFMKYDSLLAKKAFSNSSKAIDVGVVQSGNIKRFFVNGMGIGFDAEVLNTMKKIKFLRGDFLYTTAVLWTFLNFTGFQINAEIKGEVDFVSGRYLLFNVGNGRYLGGGFKLFPVAQIDDGLLDVSIIDSVRPMKFFTNFYKAFKGKHVTLKEVHYFKGSELRIIAKSPLNIQVDGELISGLKEITISIQRRALRVIK